MPEPYNDRWERTKRYLLRNFLVNPGFRLPPIPEEDRSSPDSLPDLVVEPAPNRHDDPPEFYEGLEQRIKQYHRQLFLGDKEDSSDFENSAIETKSDSEDLGPCHRTITTVAEIHQGRPERGTVDLFDNGSPVLIPRLLQFSKRVFGSGVTRKSGQGFNVSAASDEFIRRSIQSTIHHTEESYKSNDSKEHDDNIGEETDIQQLLTASELTTATLYTDETLDTEKEAEYNDTEENQEEDINKNDDIENRTDIEDDVLSPDNEEDKIDTDVENENEITGIKNTSTDWKISSSDESFDDMEPLAQSSARSIDDEVEVMRDARVTSGNQSWHGEEVQGSPALAFEAQTDADKLDSDSSRSTEINASYEEPNKEASADPQNTPPCDITKFPNEIWSVSPVEVNFEEMPRETISRESENESPEETLTRGSSKRRTENADASPSKRKKEDIAIQTGSEEHRTWEDIRTELFVGTPVVYRLCRCHDHVCS